MLRDAALSLAPLPRGGAVLPSRLKASIIAGVEKGACRPYRKSNEAPPASPKPAHRFISNGYGRRWAPVMLTRWLPIFELLSP